jgi:hypothetical protein
MTEREQMGAIFWPLLVVGIGVALAAFFVPVESTPTGGRTLEGWWVAMAGISIIVSGLGWHSQWRAAALLISLLILTLAAQLTLTRPHWAMSLRVAPHEIERSEHFLALAVLVLQALTVAIMSWRHISAIVRFVRSLFSVRCFVLGGALFLFCASNVAAFYPEVLDLGYAAKLFGRTYVAALLLFVANLLLLWQIARAMPRTGVARITFRIRERFSLPGDSGGPRPWDGRLPWCAAMFVLVVSSCFGFGVLEGTAQLSDEVVYQFMAKVFASGALGSPAPPVPEAFDMWFVEVRDGIRYGVQIPGWPLTLAIGMFFGVPWLVNPVIAAISIVLAHALARRLIDRGTANVSVLLLATSPWFLILSSVYQPHAVTLLAALASWLGIHRAMTEDGLVWPFAAGLAAGFAFLVRPMDGILIGGSGFLYAALAHRPRGFGLTRMTTFVMGCVATGAIGLLLNYALTGDLFTYAMNAYFDRAWGVGANRLGFGAEVGQLWGVLDPIPGHGWRDVLFNLNLNLFALNYELYGWGVGSLFLFAVHLLWGRLNKQDWMWLFFIAWSLAMFSLYWFNGGTDYGPRYWYATLFPLVLLTVRGLDTLVATIDQWVPDRSVGARAGLLIALLACSGVVVFGSWRVVGKYIDYRHKNPLVLEYLESGTFGERGLVVVDAVGKMEYAALELNDLIPGEHGPVFARDLGPETTAALMKAFPDRPVYRLILRAPMGRKTAIVERIRRPESEDH